MSQGEDQDGTMGESKAGTVSEVVLDCGVQGCCPTLRKLSDEGFELVGDDGQKVALTRGQVEHLQRAIGQLIAI